MKNIKYVVLLLTLNQVTSPEFEEIIELPSYYDWFTSPIDSYYKKNELLSKTLRDAALVGDISKLEEIPLSYNLPDENGNNFLHIAIINGNREFAQIALDKANIDEFLDLLNDKNIDDISPLDLLNKKIEMLNKTYNTLSNVYKQLWIKWKNLKIARLKSPKKDLATIDAQIAQVDENIKIIKLQKNAILTKKTALQEISNYITIRLKIYQYTHDKIYQYKQEML